MRSSDSARTHRTSGRGRIRAIEFGRAPAEAPTLGYARYVGRVGALAIALGVGSAVASMPMAFADTTGSAGSSADNYPFPYPGIPFQKFILQFLNYAFFHQ